MVTKDSCMFMYVRALSSPDQNARRVLLTAWNLGGSRTAGGERAMSAKNEEVAMMSSGWFDAAHHHTAPCSPMQSDASAGP